jgi:hypothetical protein
VIFFFTLLWVAFIALSLYLVQSGVVPLNPEQLRYTRSLSSIDYGITALVSILNVAGAIALIRLRSAAIYLYATALAVGILHRLIAANIIATAPTSDRPSGIQTFIGFAVWAAICAYAWRLKARGVLK